MAAAIAVAAVFAACGDDDDSVQDDDDSVQDDDKVTDAPSPSSTAPTNDGNTLDTTAASVSTADTSAVSNPGTSSSATTTFAPVPGFGPSISEQCPDGQTPVAAGYDNATGSQAWITCVVEQVQYAVLDSDGHTVLAVEGMRDDSHPSGGIARFVGLDARDGTVLWRLDQRATSSPSHNPLSNGLAVVTFEDTDEYVLAGVNAATGDIVWSHPIRQGAEVANTDSFVIVQSNAPPDGQLPGPIIVAPSGPPPALPGTPISRRALHRLDGSEAWTSDTTIRIDAQQDFNSMVTSGSTVIAMPGPSAFDAATGDEIWRIESEAPTGKVWPGSDDVVLVGGQDDPLVGLDLATGAVRWAAAEGHPYFDNVWAVGGGAVYVSTESDVIAYELADGAERWRRPLTETMFVAPWIATDSAVFGIHANLVAWSPDDGSTLWSTNHSPNDPVRMASVVAAESNVVVTFSSQPMMD